MMDLRISPQLHATVIVDAPESVDWAQYGYLRKETGEWYMPICECITPLVYADESSPEHRCYACGRLAWSAEEE